MFSVHEEEEAAARKEEQKRRRTERERAKAQQAQDATGNIPDELGEREERHTGTVYQFFFFAMLMMLIQHNSSLHLMSFPQKL